MKKILVVAPHPDDETLGCGGTLLKHKERGDEIHWLIVTSIHEEYGYTAQKVAERQNEIITASEMYSFASTHQLNIPTAKLDTYPNQDIVSKISSVFNEIKPQYIYIPYRGDVHTDHSIVFDAAISCTKWFRYPFIEKVLAYETLSETDFGLNPDINGFRPNEFVDISQSLLRKIEIMNVFKSEMGEFPFPRSERAIQALANVRGCASGFHAAEAFMLLKARW